MLSATCGNPKSVDNRRLIKGPQGAMDMTSFSSFKLSHTYFRNKLLAFSRSSNGDAFIEKSASKTGGKPTFLFRDKLESCVLFKTDKSAIPFRHKTDVPFDRAKRKLVTPEH